MNVDYGLGELCWWRESEGS